MILVFLGLFTKIGTFSWSFEVIFICDIIDLCGFSPSHILLVSHPHYIAYRIYKLYVSRIDDYSARRISKDPACKMHNDFARRMQMILRAE